MLRSLFLLGCVPGWLLFPGAVPPHAMRPRAFCQPEGRLRQQHRQFGHLTAPRSQNQLACLSLAQSFCRRRRSLWRVSPNGPRPRSRRSPVSVCTICLPTTTARVPLQRPDCRLAAQSFRTPSRALLLEDIMSSATYRLTQIHRRLDDAITQEMRRLLPDSFKLLRMKKLRLAVKDRLTTAMQMQAAG